jgi:hypothetical protein
MDFDAVNSEKDASGRREAGQTRDGRYFVARAQLSRSPVARSSAT